MKLPLPKIVRKAWRDFLSIYYANTPTWRWLKSGALVFLGFFAWAGGAVLLSVKPGWGFLSYLMAYGFFLVVYGPFTHLVVVPMTIRLRRTAQHPITRTFSRNSGKINLTLFFAIVILLGTLTPSIMMLEFSPDALGSDEPDVRGELVCEQGAEEITCHVENPQGIDHVTVESGGEQIARADEPPFNVTFAKDEVGETRTGPEYQVTYRDEDGDRLLRQVRTVR
jgi:hypothetical protein